jgi:hypothetical protein
MNTSRIAVNGIDSSGLAPLWTVVEAAKYLGVSERYLRDSAVPKAKFGRLVRYLPAEVMEFARRMQTHSLLKP